MRHHCSICCFFAAILRVLNVVNFACCKHDLINIDYEIFHEIVHSILSAHAPLKKHLRANHATFVTKEFRKGVRREQD